MNYYFATRNPGKQREVAAMLAEAGLNVSPLPDNADSFDAVEDGDTFAANAVSKAKQWQAWLAGQGITGVAVLADDSGLCIDALGGGPGVYSARYLGENTPHSEKCKHILKQMENVPQAGRGARFVCVIACALPDGRVLTSEGKIEGEISYEPRGGRGFGYDPIFYVPAYGLTTAELPFDIKNRISHRGKALDGIRGQLVELT
jgi:XTP/dITP diphosphohydrolase